MRVSSKMPLCYPFIKWAGGKTQLLPKLYAFVPAEFNRYFEPFLGGGAMFFYLISVKNKRFTSYLSDIKRAARFITLNRTCYNGLYRVNRLGVFNVPWGKYKDPVICNSKNLRNVSLVLHLSKAAIKICNYKKILLGKAKEGDFIYLDPPYNPTSSTAYFTKYTNTGFNYKDQEELAAVFRKLDDRKCKILLSNSDTYFIKELYSDFAEYITEVDAVRAINSKGSKRAGHKELIIRN